MTVPDPKQRCPRVDFQVLDPRFKAGTKALYDSLREHGQSVVPIRLPTGLEAWLVTSCATARALLNDARLSKDATRCRPAETDAARREGGASHTLFKHLLTMDPPEHTRLRSVIAREFSSRRVELLRPRIREIACELLDAIVSGAESDLIPAFARPLPLRVICGLIGVPGPDESRFHQWSERLMSADLEDAARVPAIADELHDYLLRLASRKRARPDQALYTALVAAHDRGELTANEVTAMAFLLLSAGYETSTHLISSSVLVLLQHPQQWSRLCSTPELAAAAVEETLRLESPLEVATARFATGDISIDDTLIRRGDLVFVGLGAANRDMRPDEHVDDLDLDRGLSRSHLAFGFGVHYCLGAALARAEGEIALVELSQRFPRLELAVPADGLEWMPGLIMRGLRGLPVRWLGR